MKERPPIGRVVENVLNKQSWSAVREGGGGWSSSRGEGEVLKPPYRKNVLRTIHKGLGSGLILWCDISNGKGT